MNNSENEINFWLIVNLSNIKFQEQVDYLIQDTFSGCYTNGNGFVSVMFTNISTNDAVSKVIQEMNNIAEKINKIIEYEIQDDDFQLIKSMKTTNIIKKIDIEEERKQIAHTFQKFLKDQHHEISSALKSFLLYEDIPHHIKEKMFIPFQKAEADKTIEFIWDYILKNSINKIKKKN